jgi:peptide/nickel transport system substrate-binding protein
MVDARRLITITVLLSALAACAPSPPPTTSGAEPPKPPVINRTVVVVARVEPNTLALKALAGNFFGAGLITHPFNAALEVYDARGVAIPQLAEALPTLQSESWRVFPDGRMETGYRLKPNLMWHDGAPLSAEDFVFAWRLYANPAFGLAGIVPMNHIEEVVTPDPRSIMVRWRGLYPDAGVLGSNSGIPPLPRHLLDQSYRELDPVAFTNQPFWIRDYVGLGAYKVDRWEPGAFIEGVAFDGYVFGKPKIERFRAAFIGDTNTLIASALAGEVHFLADFTLGYSDGVNLERQWQDSKAGVVHYYPLIIRISLIQLRPELLSNPLQLDPRVRKAIAHGTDVVTAFEVVTGSKGALTVAPMNPDDDFYPLVERSSTKYPYDARRTRQLLEEAGLVRGADGMYQGAAGEPFVIDYSYAIQTDNQREHEIFAASLRDAGIGVRSRALSAVNLRDPQMTKLFPGLSATSGAGSFSIFTSKQIPTPQNAYNGSNNGAWVNAEYERLLNAFSSTLEPSERAQQIAAMARIWSDELPGIPHYFNTVINVWSASLSGVTARKKANVSALDHVHLWEWNS